MESSSKLGRRATKFSSQTMENISRATASTYKNQDSTLYSHSTGYRCTSTRILRLFREGLLCSYIHLFSKDATQTVISRLLTSKTRVSPVKTQSLPRLELCSALLLANLLHATLPTLTVPISETFAWSDSKITLAWLKSEPRRWQPFVANRVAQILELTPNVHWNFVSGLENPADCGTRGIPPTKLEN
ncbi:DUF1758 domain-containing protein [Trichonephila clavata]|uniref:DUF1758 domain-containing protein n=1 Tax=Trichonephila clavata TaxID=2740835 RepID=A0A8X6HK31_TRICU|nr:DUF1758 domain-containing protein [Trichonephila clavata]